MPRQDGYRIEALDRGLRVLALFTPLQRRLTAGQVVQRLGLPQSSVYRLLRTLERSGFLRVDADGAYVPGHAVLTLGYAALQSDDAVEAAREPLKNLARETGETTNYGTLLDDRVLYLVRYKTEHLLITNIFPGSTLPARSTSMGKLLLALAERPSLPAVEESLLGPNAILDEDAYRAELARVRAQDWSIQDEELAPNLRSIAVPVRSHQGVLGAINLVVDGHRHSRDDLVAEFLPRLRRTAAEISLRLGYLEAAR